MTNLTTTHAEGTAVFSVSGNVLSTTAPQIREQLERLFADARLRTVEIDLRAAQMVDSVGLNLLVWAWKTLKERKGSLRLRTSSPDIERTLRFTRLSNYIEVVRDH